MSQGAQVADPQRRNASSGKTYVIASMRVLTEDDSILASLIAFGSEATAALLVLNEGDEIAVSGRAKLSFRRGKGGAVRTGLSITVERVMSPYAVHSKCVKASESKPARVSGAAHSAVPSTYSEPAHYGPSGGFERMRDDIPWEMQP